MGQEVWRLTICGRSGSSFSVCGTEEVLGASIDEIQKALDGIDGVSAKTVVIQGFYDSYDRAPFRAVVLIEAVESVSLVKLY